MQFIHVPAVCVLALSLGLAACGRQEESAPHQTTDARVPSEAPMQDQQASASPPGQPPVAAAQLAATQGNTATGSLAFADSPEGVRITGSLQGLKPNAEHGFHVHEKGDCSAPDASSAGEHFNPTGQPHGNPTSGPHHAGDMVNVKTDEQGNGQVDTTVRGVSVHGGQGADLLGKAVVVHENRDDYKTQPSGNSGKRIACGVIALQPPA